MSQWARPCADEARLRRACQAADRRIAAEAPTTVAKSSGARLRSAASRSERMCATIAVTSGGTKGGFAWNEPVMGWKSKKEPMEPKGASTSAKPGRGQGECMQRARECANACDGCARMCRVGAWQSEGRVVGASVGLGGRCVQLSVRLRPPTACAWRLAEFCMRRNSPTRARDRSPEQKGADRALSGDAKHSSWHPNPDRSASCAPPPSAAWNPDPPRPLYRRRSNNRS
eukprot:scaffold16594_cov124-Isochrysis_galbana.AAC.3